MGTINGSILAFLLLLNIPAQRNVYAFSFRCYSHALRSASSFSVVTRARSVIFNVLSFFFISWELQFFDLMLYFLVCKLIGLKMDDFYWLILSFRSFDWLKGIFRNNDFFSPPSSVKAEVRFN